MVAAKAWTTALDKSNDAHQHHLLESLWLHQKPQCGQRRVTQNHAYVAGTSSSTLPRHAGPHLLAGSRGESTRTPASPGKRRELSRSLASHLGVSAISAARTLRRASEIAVESLIYDQDEYIKHTLNETNRTLDRRVKQFNESKSN